MLVGRFHFAFSKKLIFLIGVFVILLIAVPLTVYIVQQQQQTQIGARAATVIELVRVPASEGTKAKLNDTVTFNVNVNPATNVVSGLTLRISYDPEKLEPVDKGFKEDASLAQHGFSTLQNPIVDAENGRISLAYAVSPNSAIADSGIKCADPTNLAGCTPTTIGTLSFVAIAPGQSQISFERTPPNETIVTSRAGNPDQPNENVLANAPPAAVIVEGEVSPSPSASPSEEPSVSPSASPSEEPSASPESSPIGEAPICDSLGADVTEGTVPLAITFTANGSDSDGTVEKITFDYGDGNTEDVTEGGGLGTETLNLQASHTYSDAGSFTASAVLTDSDGNASEACEQAITVSAAEGSQVAEASPSSSPLPATGPGNAIVGAGILGAILTGLGILLFFAL